MSWNQKLPDHQQSSYWYGFDYEYSPCDATYWRFRHYANVWRGRAGEHYHCSLDVRNVARIIVAAHYETLNAILHRTYWRNDIRCITLMYDYMSNNEQNTVIEYYSQGIAAGLTTTYSAAGMPRYHKLISLLSCTKMEYACILWKQVEYKLLLVLFITHE